MFFLAYKMFIYHPYQNIYFNSVFNKTNKSIQPMSSLFDQALHIYGDIVAVGIIEKLKINRKKLWRFHANLE